MHRLIIASALAAIALPGAAAAQSDVGARVGKLESEMRAVQRKVFPNGAGQYLQPEITQAPSNGPVPGSPSSSAVADLTGRVASLEGQMAMLTGQIEQNQYRLRQLQEQFDAFRQRTDAKLSMIGTAGAAAPTGDDTGSGSGSGTMGSSSAPRGGPALPPRPTPLRPATDGAPAASDDGANAAKASTGDPAEDAYLLGYRLWSTKKYPEAEAQLKKVVAQYPKNRRASYAQNLLGRAYLDDGKPSLASMAFYDNYKKMPEGERAPDSLYYLAQALMKLDKPADACKVYSELADVYGAKISTTMQANVAKGRAAAKCQ